MTPRKKTGVPRATDLAGQNLQIERAARRLVRCRSRIDGGGMNHTALTSLLAERDAAWHDLLIALGEPCECDEGTCPGYIGQ